MSFLRILNGNTDGESQDFDFALTKNLTTIGRLQDCDLALPQSSVSRRHAQVRLGNDGFVIEDLKSTNGVFVNDQKLRVPQLLEPGDFIRVGTYKMSFHEGACENSSPVAAIPTTLGFEDSDAEIAVLKRLELGNKEENVAEPQEKLQAILQIMQELDSLNIDEMLPKTLQNLTQIFPQADRLYVMLKSEPEQQLELAAFLEVDEEDTVSPNSPINTSSTESERKSENRSEHRTVRSNPVSRTIALRAMNDRVALLSANAAIDERFNEADSVQDWKIRSMICAPLSSADGEPLGVIYVDTLDPLHQFTASDLDVLGSVAIVLGHSVDHCRLHDGYLRSARLSAIGEMMTGLAHESRNALQRSQANLERLSIRLEHQPDELELIARVQQAQDQLHQLYEQVRNYAAPIVLERQSHDLGDLLTSAWESLEPQREGRSVELHANLDDTMNRRCLVDSLAIERVMCNLLENSLAACTDPVVITVDWAEQPIGEREAMQIICRDNGPGLTHEQRQRAFEPFFTTKAKGTGLGLAISRRSIEAHRGWIDVSANSGENNGANNESGAAFVIALPRE